MEEKIEWLRPEELTPHPKNPKKHPPDQIKKLVKSLETYKWTRPVLYIKHGNDKIIIAGHGIVQAAIIKKCEVKCHRLNLSYEKATAYVIADNRFAELAEWDEDILGKLLSEIKDKDLLDSIGYDEAEINRLIQNIQEPEQEGDFDVEGALEKPKFNVKEGDIFQIKNHRLMCGDSTKEKDVKKLMDGKKAIACITDPPYSVNYENQKRLKGGKSRKEKGDTYIDPNAEQLLNFIDLLPSNLLVMTYLFNKHFQLLAEKTKNWDILYECIWLKHDFTFIMGRNYQPKHEPILIFRRKKTKSYFNVPNNQTTVFEFDRPAKNIEHPTIKPLGLYILLVEYHSKLEDIIFDPFGGSGTTLIASEQLQRICYMMEIDIKYCSVILERFINYKKHDNEVYRLNEDGTKTPIKELENENT